MTRGVFSHTSTGLALSLYTWNWAANLSIRRRICSEIETCLIRGNFFLVKVRLGIYRFEERFISTSESSAILQKPRDFELANRYVRFPRLPFNHSA